MILPKWQTNKSLWLMGVFCVTLKQVVLII